MKKSKRFLLFNYLLFSLPLISIESQNKMQKFIYNRNYSIIEIIRLTIFHGSSSRRVQQRSLKIRGIDLPIYCP